MRLENWRTLERHSLSAAYDDLPGPTFDLMVAGLQEYGILADRKVTLHDGKVLDGWQLLRACIAAGIEPEFATLPASIEADGFVEKLNDLRRHETPEKAMRRVGERRERVAAARAEMKSLRDIAKAEKVSVRTVRNDLKEGGVDPRTDEALGAVKDRKGVMRPAKSTILCERCGRIGAVKDCTACKELRTPKKKQTNSGAGANPPEETAAESTGNAGERAELGVPSATVADTPPAPIDWATLNAQLQAALDAVCRGDTNAAVAAIESCFAFVADHGGPPKPKSRKGRAPDPLFDAVAHVTGTDPKASGGHVGKVCAALRKAEPPYTPEEVAALPAAMAAAHSWFDGLLTLGMVEKYIGLTRAKLPEKPRSDRNGTGTGRPVGPSCRIGVTAKQLEAIAAKTIRCGPVADDPGKGGAPVG